MKNKQLWDKLASFMVDDNSAPRSFLKKLAKENGWSMELAARAFEEYKKFMYLATIMEVTPSKRIDEVWHLHLQYTKSYWKDLCSGILGTEIHHNPGDGNEVAEAKFRDVYKETKEAYVVEFGQTPPSDIWGGDEVVRDERQIIDTVRKRSKFVNGVRAALGISSVLLMTSGTAWMLVLGLILGGVIVAAIINSIVRSNRSNSGSSKSYGSSSYGNSSYTRSYSSCSSKKKKKDDDNNNSGCSSSPIISSCSSSCSGCSSHSSCSSSSGGGDSGGGGSSSCGSSCGGGGCGGGGD